jgi:hypothetical protein
MFQVQIALIVVSVCLVILGIKGFTGSGLALSKATILHGWRARIAGTLCIIAGIVLVPLTWKIIGIMVG